MNAKKVEFVLKLAGAWEVQPQRERTTHKVNAVILRCDSQHEKFKPGAVIVLHTRAEFWPEGMPEVSDRTALIAHTLDSPSAGPDRWRPSFYLVGAKSVPISSKSRRMVAEAFKQI